MLPAELEGHRPRPITKRRTPAANRILAPRTTAVRFGTDDPALRRIAERGLSDAVWRQAVRHAGVHKHVGHRRWLVAPRIPHLQRGRVALQRHLPDNFEIRPAFRTGQPQLHSGLVVPVVPHLRIPLEPADVAAVPEAVLEQTEPASFPGVVYAGAPVYQLTHRRALARQDSASDEVVLQRYFAVRLRGAASAAGRPVRRLEKRHAVVPRLPRCRKPVEEVRLLHRPARAVDSRKALPARTVRRELAGRCEPVVRAVVVDKPDLHTVLVVVRRQRAVYSGEAPGHTPRDPPRLALVQFVDFVVDRLTGFGMSIDGEREACRPFRRQPRCGEEEEGGCQRPAAHGMRLSTTRPRRQRA